MESSGGQLAGSEGRPLPSWVDGVLRGSQLRAVLLADRRPVGPPSFDPISAAACNPFPMISSSTWTTRRGRQVMNGVSPVAGCYSSHRPPFHPQWRVHPHVNVLRQLAQDTLSLSLRPSRPRAPGMREPTGSAGDPGCGRCFRLPRNARGCVYGTTSGASPIA